MKFLCTDSKYNTDNAGAAVSMCTNNGSARGTGMDGAWYILVLVLGTVFFLPCVTVSIHLIPWLGRGQATI